MWGVTGEIFEKNETHYLSFKLLYPMQFLSLIANLCRLPSDITLLRLESGRSSQKIAPVSVLRAVQAGEKYLGHEFSHAYEWPRVELSNGYRIILNGAWTDSVTRRSRATVTGEVW